MYKTLIVEDDPMVAMIHRQYIEAASQFKVVETCFDGMAALKYLEANEVEVVVLDVHMPNLSGMEVLKKIRQKKYPVSVVMVTAANDADAITEALQHGVVDYLVKPFTQDRFTEALAKVDAYRNTLSSNAIMDQSQIDSIIRGAQAAKTTAPPPKGIQEKTIGVLANYIKNHGKDWKTGDEIAADVNLSSVTVRRYMNHLVQTGLAESQMDYETGGRPRLLYRLSRGK